MISHPSPEALIFPFGLLALIAFAIWSSWFEAARLRGNQPEWSHGEYLRACSVAALAIFPLGADLLYLMLLASGERYFALAVAGLFAVPSIAVWVFASRYLETLRNQPAKNGERPDTLWAYGLSSVNALMMIFIAIYVFVELAIQQGWTEP
jgi:hypothetical protein